jgi:LacI family transcriptional regulator
MVVTLEDVARHAKVSKAAASVVLSGKISNIGVSEATRQRIQKAAADLRYHPNAMARGLNRVRLDTLGVSFGPMTPENVLSDSYSFAVLKGILNVALGAGYNVTHFNKPWRDTRQSAAGFRDQGLDGFLIVAPDPQSDIAAGLTELGIPIVVISSASDEHRAPSVDVDNVMGVRLALEHLLELGHRRIAHLTFHNQQFDMRTRMEGFRAVMAEAGIGTPPEYVPKCWGCDVERAFYLQTRSVLSLPEPPTAILAGSDWIALRIIEAASDLGVRVPKQLSVVGFDDTPDAALSEPPLTTIRQPLIAMGQEAARMLIALVEGEHVENATRWFEPSLIVRGSTAPPL